MSAAMSTTLSFSKADVLAAEPAAGTVFDPGNVRKLAQELAQKAYSAPNVSLPDNLKNLDYDKYRKIRFIPDRALWRGEGVPFRFNSFMRVLFF